MKRLYQIHRWVGVVLALFMLLWFGSGLVIMYASPTTLSLSQKLAGRELVQPQAGWLSLAQAWERSGQPGAAATLREARLVRQAGQALWLVEDGQGRRWALSALSGQVHTTTAEEARQIGQHWLAAQTEGSTGPLRLLDTGAQDSAVRNLERLAPFHRLGVGDSSRELLISQRTGEVVRDSTAWDRATYWAGNWVHLLRPLESVGLREWRRDVLLWLAGAAFLASLTGLIIGWKRWRPGWGGRPTYSQGRQHPYRDGWNTWHFWCGLIGGTAALLWTLSGFFNGNPWQVFSPATPSQPELTRYQGAKMPAVALAWQPAPLAEPQHNAVVELAWQHLGAQAVLLAQTRTGQRLALPLPQAVATFDEPTLRAAALRLAGKPGATLGQAHWQTTYDSYYYLRHHQDPLTRPLPVLVVPLGDAADTRAYLDPVDGRLVLRQDTSRRAYRWLWSALHHWDFGWLAHRPVWDGWMLTWVLMGLVLGVTSVVLGSKRLARTVPVAGKTPKPQSLQAATQPA